MGRMAQGGFVITTTEESFDHEGIKATTLHKIIEALKQEVTKKEPDIAKIDENDIRSISIFAAPK